MPTEEESPPSQNETTSKGSPLSNNPTLTSIKEMPPLQSETSSRNSPPKDVLSQPTLNDNPKTENAEKVSDADPHMQEKPPSENETTAGYTSPTKNDCTQTTAADKQETDDIEAINQDSAADAAVQEVPPVENESTAKDSSPSPQITPTCERETDKNKNLKEELPDDAGRQSPVQEISPADDETISTHSERVFAQSDGDDAPETEGLETLKQDSINDADHSSKAIFSWKKLRNLLPKRGKRSQPKSSVAIKTTAETSDERELLSNLIQADVDYIAKGAKKLGQYNDQLNSLLREASKDFEEIKKQGNEKDFRDLRKAMIKLKVQIPSKYQVDADEKDPHKKFHFGSQAKQSIPENVLNLMPQLQKTGVFKSSIEFNDFEARYNGLPLELKLCLLCFSVFPENAIIKKRLMVQWWVSEGFACEKVASEYFTQLIEKGFIEPVNENRSLFVGCCRMHPFYRSALVTLAERAKFFNFDTNGEPIQNFSGSFQSCLVGEGLISYEDLQNGLVTVFDLEKIHLLINVNESILEFKPDWFSKMRNVNFLYLGRWRMLATAHIEVEDTLFLDGLENMRYMKFLSLQGVSNIIALPESILQLTNLKTLDIRACHNLETIPEEIGLLKGLTHLDMSECYLLDRMPKSLALLTGLIVLKGFVVGSEKGNSSCTLDDLKKLPNLIKLCIYTCLREFPNDQHVIALGNLMELCKLTITWGGSALRAAADDRSDILERSDGNKKDNPTVENTTLKKQEPQGSLESSNGLTGTPRLPLKLEKLDLKCFPMSTTPNWLALNNLKDLNLKKLYIRGGRFADLGQYQEVDDWNMVCPVKNTWKVQVLRLKYLSEIEMEWRQLQELFPDLVYLEQVSCPKLTLFPCDANGVWINKTKLKEFRGGGP